MNAIPESAVLTELLAIRLFGVDLHKRAAPKPAEQPTEGEEPVQLVTLLEPEKVLESGKSEIATIPEAEEAWRKSTNENREHWRAVAGRLLPQLEEDGITVRPRAEARKTLKLALTVPAHAAYDIPK